MKYCVAPVSSEQARTEPSSLSSAMRKKMKVKLRFYFYINRVGTK